MKLSWIVLVLMLLVGTAPAASISDYNIVWQTQSQDASGSMPLGGGNLQCNVWVEKDDLFLLMGSTDTFLNGKGRLAKLGLIRMRLTPNPFPQGFRQELKLSESVIEIQGGKPGEISETNIRLWVDVFKPVVHLTMDSKTARNAEVTYESTIFKGQKADGGLMFFYRHREASDPDRDLIIKQYDLKSLESKVPNPLQNLTFGGLITSDQLTWDESGCLKTIAPIKRLDMRAVIRIDQDASFDQWRSGVQALSKKTASTAKSDFKKTLKWWGDFWTRSWIMIDADLPIEDRIKSDSWKVGRNYHLARYMLACNRSGRFPTQFNAGMFTFKDGERYWEFCQFMSQNQRLVYWPHLKSGDFDIILPGINYYRDLAPLEYAVAKHYWGIKGAIYPEGLSIYGLNSLGVYDKSKGDLWGHTRLEHLTFHYTSTLDFAYMTLLYGTYSGQSIREYMPVIRGCVEFYDNYYQKREKDRTGKPLDKNGRLVLYPTNALELYQGCKNNSDALAGLHAITKEILELPEAHLTDSDRAYFRSVQDRLPDMPMTELKGCKVIAVAESWESEIDPRNAEFPQMYSVFPFHRYGLGLPELEVARDTWRYGAKNEKMQKDYFCWYQSAIFTARLGLTEEAKTYTLKKFLHPNYPGCTKERAYRFPAFWETIKQGFDIAPDIDHAGCAMVGLQEMIMQTPGKKILINPAWPKDWNCNFKLHAPYNTIVQGKVIDGKVSGIKVTPRSRRKDVVIMKAE